ncbi:hypothetical protein SDC9_23827 [bioreactor metagenome]|uniref:Uncharacterized protein n=1 Tax=bioreactor metagenome TaxID=1076179 RepID=A0A644UG48_9ZZZZ
MGKRTANLIHGHSRLNNLIHLPPHLPRTVFIRKITRGFMQKYQIGVTRCCDLDRAKLISLYDVLRFRVWYLCGHKRKNQPRIGANPALRAKRIGFASPHSRNPASLSCSSLHRDRSGKSCRRPSGSQLQFLSPSHFAIARKEQLSHM